MTLFWLLCCNDAMTIGVHVSVELLSIFFSSSAHF